MIRYAEMMAIHNSSESEAAHFAAAGGSAEESRRLNCG